MKQIYFEAGTVAGPYREGYVEDVAAEVGVDFPMEYLDFMRKSNGGEPKQKYFRLGSDTKVVERFLSFVEDYKTNPLGWYDIEAVWSQIEDRLDDGVCPFAALFAGDFLCFDQREDGRTVIVMWDHEQAGAGRPPFVSVADDFESFLDMLTG